MGRFGANVIVFVLNNVGYLIERSLEEKPDWTYNDLAPWKYAELPRALGCADWFTARVTTLGELDEATKAARASNTGAYIEIVAGKMDMPPARPLRMADLKPCTATRHNSYQTEKDGECGPAFAMCRKTQMSAPRTGELEPCIDGECRQPRRP